MIPNIFSVIHISLYNFKADYGSRTKATTVGASILKRALLQTARLSPRLDVARMGEYKDLHRRSLRRTKPAFPWLMHPWHLPLGAPATRLGNKSAFCPGKWQPLFGSI